MLCWVLVLAARAQQPALTWYPGNGTVLDFTQSPALVGTSTSAPALQGAVTHTDAQGQVLLSATPTGFYDRNGQPLPNGQYATPLYAGAELYRPLLVPAPGAGQRVYFFYLAPYVSNTPLSTGVQLNYSEVDLAANNGLGGVLRKDQVLYVNLHGSFTVAANCASEGFWLIGEANRNGFNISDSIYAYKVTPAGIAAKPTISAPVSIGHSYGYKASPAGDQVVFNYDGNQTPGGLQYIQGLGLASFSQATGAVDNMLRLGPVGYEAEFSASGRMLYLCRNDSVLQFDVSSRNLAQIRASRTVLSAGGDRYRRLQLAADGRLYLDAITKLAVIAFPERKGKAAGFTPTGPALPRAIDFLPRLPPFLLYAPPLLPAAGPDVAVCAGQATLLQGAPVAGAATWSPATYLSSVTAATPTFRYTGPALADTLVLPYTRTFFDGTCLRRDVTYVTVLPPPVAGIAGSQSVCPGVAAVAYRVVAPRAGYTYQWAAVGGTVVGGQGTPTAQITWGPTNGAARVEVTTRNALQCPGPPAQLPVRINVQLQTATPQGPTQLCLNQAQGIAYEVSPTNGSVYTWTVQGGRVASGQGSSRITVDWTAAGSNYLVVNEQSTTVDTVCYGTSARLPVVVVHDTTRAQLTAASIGPASNATSALTWTFSQPPRTAFPLALLRREAGTTAWQLAASLPSTARSYRDQNLSAGQRSYEYLVQATNECAEVLESAVHRTVLLAATAPPAGPISLSWSAYQGWPAGVTGYELWRRLDADTAFTRLRQLGGSTLALGDLETTAGFAHHYRIRALTRGAAAWSNTVDLNFEHPLIIPNVFTPNGDGRNDTFFIPNLATLYADNRLEIFNRWGQRVYEQQAYRGDWSGSTVAAGTYYYYLVVPRLNTAFKGWVEVVK